MRCANASLLENWENEYHRFFDSPRLEIVRLTSKNVPRQFDKSMVERMQKMDIILTNYESLRISQLNFCAVDFDIVALDEAQKIKSRHIGYECSQGSKRCIQNCNDRNSG